MKKFALATALVMLSFPAHAADVPKAEMTKVDPSKALPVLSADELKERGDLARQLAKVHPIRPRIDATIDMLGAGIAPEQRARYFADMQKNLDYKAIDEASIKALAQIFTPAELKKMTEYYSTPEAQSVEKKTPAYETALQPAVKAALDAAITKIKYGTKKP